MSATTTTPADAAAIGAVAALPDDASVLKRVLQEVLDLLRRRDHELQQVQARLDQLLRRLYGPRTERLDPHQLLLFADLAAEAPAASPPPTPPPEEAPRKRRHNHGRQRPPAHLPRERRVHELSAAERACPCCGQTRQVIGEDVTEQYDCVPQALYVIEHVRLKYACPGCEQRRQQPDVPRPAATNGAAAAATMTAAATTAVPRRRPSPAPTPAPARSCRARPS
jgi:hypothetical protein